MSRTLEVTLTDQLVIEALELQALNTGQSIEQVIRGVVEKSAQQARSPVKARSDALTAKVGRLVRQGYADRDIAILLGISASSTAHKRKKLQLTSNRPNNRKTRTIDSTLGRDTP